LDALHAIPTWIPGGGWTLIIMAFFILGIDWVNEKRDENQFRSQITKELWR
jgi:hypothetical protein